jgi:zinc protease
VGDLDTKETLAKVKKYFGAIPRQTPPTPVNLNEAPRTAERKVILQDPLARLQRIDIAYRIPPAGDPDTRALGIAASVLGGGGGGRGGRGGGANTSRLYNLLVQDKEVAVQVSAGADRRAGPGMFRISATVRAGKSAQEVEGLISEEISKLYSQPVSDKELGRVRMALMRSAENRLTALSRAQALADAAAVYDNPDRVNTEEPAQLAVNAADIMRAAKAHLVNANKSVVITQPAGGSQGGGRRPQPMPRTKKR